MQTGTVAVEGDEILPVKCKCTFPFVHQFDLEHIDTLPYVYAKKRVHSGVFIKTLLIPSKDSKYSKHSLVKKS